MKKKQKNKENQIFESIRKTTAPPSQKFKTRKGELERKRKHKGKEVEE
jgi:hypothetical protein